MFVSILLLIGGVVGLFYGGEFLVRGATLLAKRFGISSMVVGLTVVAFGTSAPELAATLAANLDGFPDLALGNVVGSNIANIGLILGATGLAYPLATQRRFLRRELPIALAVALLLPLFLLGGGIVRWEGIVLLALLGAYLLLLLRADSDVLSEVLDDEAGEGGREDIPLPVDTAAIPDAARGPVFAIVGAAVLVVGARMLVIGAVDIADALGVPERVIGLTMVAFGTSLPELAASLVAALRRETDIILGNIVGSNVFNVLAVLGVTSLASPLPIAWATVQVDLAVMIGFSLLLFPLVARRTRVSRRSGVVLLAGYVAYVVYLYVA